MTGELENTAAAVREALQSRLLVELMGNSLAKELVLKGGLAMRLAHGSERYTKDIDLDAAPVFSVQRIQGIVRRSIASTIARTPWGRGAAGARIQCQDVHPSVELASDRCLESLCAHRNQPSGLARFI